MAIPSLVLVEKFFELLHNKDFESLEDHLSPDVTFYFPGTKPLVGPQKVIQLLRIIYHKYTNLTFDIRDIIIQENKIAVVWANSGNDARGKSYKNSGVTIFKIEKGRVVYISDFFKDTSFVKVKYIK